VIDFDPSIYFANAVPHDIPTEAPFNVDAVEAFHWGQRFGPDASFVKQQHKRALFGLGSTTFKQEIGPGCNGKSASQSGMEKAFGDVVGRMDGKCIAVASHISPGGASPQLMLFKDKRLMFISDPPVGMKLDMSIVKQLTGGDTISGRHLHKGYETYTPDCSLWLSVNNAVEFSECEAGFMERRYLELPCVTRFLPNVQPDPANGIYLRDEVHAQKMIDSTAALIWLIINEPLLDLPVPPSIQEATTETISRADTIGNLFHQHYEMAGPSDHVASAELCQVFGNIAPQKLKGYMISLGFGRPRDVRPKGASNCKGYSGLKRKRQDYAY